jgi:hypothetical protein
MHLLDLGAPPPPRLWRCRLRYTATLAANLVQCAVGCALHHTLYAPNPGGSGLRALVLTAIGNGTLWLAFYTCSNSLPFRRVVGHSLSVVDGWRLHALPRPGGCRGCCGCAACIHAACIHAACIHAACMSQ